MMMCVVGNLKDGPGIIYKSESKNDIMNKFMKWTSMGIFENVFMTNYCYVESEVKNYIEYREINGL